MSLSDSIGPDIDGRTQVVVIWEFAVEPVNATTTRFFNTAEVREAPGYREALEKRGVPFAKASLPAQQAVSAHNAEETPLFAENIERKAVAGRW